MAFKKQPKDPKKATTPSKDTAQDKPRELSMKDLDKVAGGLVARKPPKK